MLLYEYNGGSNMGILHLHTTIDYKRLIEDQANMAFSRVNPTKIKKDKNCSKVKSYKRVRKTR